jgi:DNA recombination protein Rad52
MSFTEEQIKELNAPLDASCVKERSQAGRKLSYIEGWQALAEANRIFGHDGWSRETFEVKCVAEADREIGQQKAPGFGVTYIARVRVTVDAVVREGCGTGHGIDRDLGQAHESAIKEAETDATKRALMTFGWPFGLALYDKSREHVSNGTAGEVKETIDALIAEMEQTKTPEEHFEWGERNAKRVGRAQGVKARLREAYISHGAKLRGGSSRDATPYKDMEKSA